MFFFGHHLLTLSCRIEDFNQTRLVVNNGVLSVRVFDGGVIAFDEVIETEL